MHHWTVHPKVEFHKFPPDVTSWGPIPKLLILNSEMNLNIFPILGVHSTTFDPELRNALKIFSNHGVHSTSFDPELRSEFKNFSNAGWRGQFHNFWSLNAEMHLKVFQILVEVHSTTIDLELRNERFTLISFMGFPAILSTLQPFQIYIFKRKKSKLTFTNGPQLLGKKFMANLHASLNSTCKSRISQISTRNILHKFSNPGEVLVHRPTYTIVTL